MKLSIVVPAHNEQENIRDVITQIENVVAVPHELIIVEDHCADATAQIALQLTARFPALRVVSNQLPKGFANAVRFGISTATGEAIVPVMADLCDEIKIIDKLWEKFGQGYDVVCAARYVQGGARYGGARLKGFLSSFAGKSLHALLGIPTHDVANSFKLYRSTVIKNLTTKAEGFEISMELVLKAFLAGCRITEVPTVWHERTRGTSSFKIGKLLPGYIRLYLWVIAKRLRQ
jgi:glycosyltransferase involved in cell wall biosynthesis